MAAISSMLLGALAASTAASIYTGRKQEKAQERAGQEATLAARKQEKSADEATNKMNQKAPDTSAMASANKLAGLAGNAGTMLTGPAGVDPATLQLGKKTLLGA